MSLPLVLIPLITVLISDFIKFIIQSIKHKKVDISWMFHSWWMPSWHSSLAGSVIAVTFLEQQWSHWIEFMLAVIFWIIIMYDARWIRLESSKHAKVLNQIQKKVVFDECLWHTSIEVFVWAVVWVLISYFLWQTWIFWIIV